MAQLLYLQLDIIGILVLIVTLRNIKKRNYRKGKLEQKIFTLLAIVNIKILVLDALMCLLDHQTFLFARQLNIFVTTSYYVCEAVLCAAWISYTAFKMTRNKQLLYKKLAIYMGLAAINIAIVLLNLMTGWLFIISKDNVYQRGSLFYVLSIYWLFYISYIIFEGLKRAKVSNSMERVEIYRYLFMFPFIPLVGCIIQRLFDGRHLMWNFTTISILIIFMNLQNKEITTDKLTGLYNRRSLDEYLEKTIHYIDDHKLLFVLLIDLNKFKEVNDKYGHMMGDKALVDVARLLRQSSLRYKDFVARMGGDEFVIVGKRRSAKQIENFMQVIQESVSEFNEKAHREYTLSLSIGYAIWDEENMNTLDELISMADKKMYERKMRYHLKSYNTNRLMEKG